MINNSMKNIGIAVAVAVLLTGCQSLSQQGSSTHGGASSEKPAKKLQPITTVDFAKRHFRQANYGLAEKNFRKAVELRPSDAEAWLGLAASYDHLGLFSRSDRAYKQVIKLVGPKPAVLNNQGYSQLLRGNKKQARKLFNRAARLDPQNAKIKGNLALLEKV